MSAPENTGIISEHVGKLEIRGTQVWVCYATAGLGLKWRPIIELAPLLTYLCGLTPNMSEEEKIQVSFDTSPIRPGEVREAFAYVRAPEEPKKERYTVFSDYAGGYWMVYDSQIGQHAARFYLQCVPAESEARALCERLNRAAEEGRVGG